MKALRRWGLLLVLIPPAGCAPNIRQRATFPTKVSPLDTDLTACYYGGPTGSGGHPDAMRYEAFKRARLIAADVTPNFQNIRFVPAESDSEGCDIMVSVDFPGPLGLGTEAGPVTLTHGVYAARGKEFLARVNVYRRESGSPDGLVRLIGEKLYQVFAKGTEFYARARGVRPAGAATGDAVSKAELRSLIKEALGKEPAGEAAALSSDVDKPGYQLKQRPDDFALVVGIGRYSEIAEAQFGERDAEAVRDHLYALGLPRRNVVHLTGERAGYKGLEKYVETWLPANVSERSRVFVYFSGHGAPDPKTGDAYLLPYDGDPGFLETTGYPIRRLYEKLGALKAKEVIVAMDACFSGAGGRSVLAKGARPLVMKASAAAVPRNLTVFAATSADQITSTIQNQGHGTFTYHFLKGLSGGAADASGKVTAGSLYEYLKPRVQDEARVQNRDQIPVLQGPGDRELARF